MLIVSGVYEQAWLRSLSPEGLKTTMETTFGTSPRLSYLRVFAARELARRIISSKKPPKEWLTRLFPWWISLGAPLQTQVLAVLAKTEIWGVMWNPELVQLLIHPWPEKLSTKLVRLREEIYHLVYTRWSIKGEERKKDDLEDLIKDPKTPHHYKELFAWWYLTHPENQGSRFPQARQFVGEHTPFAKFPTFPSGMVVAEKPLPAT